MRREYSDENYQRLENMYNEDIRYQQELIQNNNDYYAQLPEDQQKDLEPERVSINNDYTKMITQAEGSKIQLQNTYAQAEEIDHTHKVNIEAIGLETDLYTNNINILISCLKPAGSDTYYSLDTILQKTRNTEQTIKETTIQIKYNYYITTGRWRDLIKKRDERTLEDIIVTAEDYDVLFMISMNCTDEELEEFIRSMYDNNIGDPPSADNWQMNQRLFSQMQTRYAQQIQALRSDYYALKNASDEDLQALFGDGYSIEQLRAARDAEMSKLQTELNHLRQNQDLLTAASHLQVYRKRSPAEEASEIPGYTLKAAGAEQTGDDYINLTAHEEIHDMKGTAADGGPPITIKRHKEDPKAVKDPYMSENDIRNTYEDGSYIITFDQDPGTIGIQGDTTRIVQVKPTKSAASAVNEAQEIVNNHMDPQYDRSAAVAAKVDTYGIRKVSGKTLSRIADILKEVNPGIVGKATGTVIPYVGDAINIAYDIGKQELEVEKQRQAAEDIEAVMLSTDASTSFDMDINVTSVPEQPSKSTITVSPGPNTDMRVHNYNMWVEWKLASEETNSSQKERIMSIGNGGKITENDLTSYEAASIDAMMNEMTSEERDLLFESSHRRLTAEEVGTFSKAPDTVPEAEAIQKKDGLKEPPKTKDQILDELRRG